VELVEQAFLFLVNERAKEPPQELQHLENQDWLQLQRLLMSLQIEKSYSELSQSNNAKKSGR
jgi:hypothetical protein